MNGLSKKMIKSIVTLIVMMLFFTNTAFAEQKYPIVYVSLGDSLAAGQTPNREIDYGYSDLIAQQLDRYYSFAYFSKDLSFPGFTTADVLNVLKSNEADDLLKRANLITISAGANDLLQVVHSNPMAGTLSFQQVQADFALNTVRINFKNILSELKVKAPNAEIYVMGYYFPFPHAHEAQKNGTLKQLNSLNDILRNEAEESGATFVSVEEHFEKEGKQLIPNPSDVHPNMEGYRRMANAFLNTFSPGGWLEISKNQMPTPNPMTFEDILKMRETLTKPTTEKVAYQSHQSMSKTRYVLSEIRMYL